MKNNDLYYELNYINANNKDTLITSIYDIKKRDKGFYVHTINNNDIDSINKDSPIHLLRALYTCKSFAICKENGESFINKDNAGKILGYKSNFANIFIFGKDSLSDEYLQARKDLYKSVTKIREERQSEYEKERERISNLTYEEYQTELKDKQRQARLSNNKDSYLLESQDKNNIIIFLDKINPKDLENKNIYSN
ncbi:lipase, partial [Helicobacter sp. MIT 14-3879]